MENLNELFIQHVFSLTGKNYLVNFYLSYKIIKIKIYKDDFNIKDFVLVLFHGTIYKGALR